MAWFKKYRLCENYVSSKLKYISILWSTLCSNLLRVINIRLLIEADIAYKCRGDAMPPDDILVVKNT